MLSGAAAASAASRARADWFRIRAVLARVPVRVPVGPVLSGVPSCDPLADGPLLHRPRRSRARDARVLPVFAFALALAGGVAAALILALAAPFAYLPFACAGRDCLALPLVLVAGALTESLGSCAEPVGGEEGAVAEMAGSSSSISRSFAARRSIASAIDMGRGIVSVAIHQSRADETKHFGLYLPSKNLNLEYFCGRAARSTRG